MCVRPSSLTALISWASLLVVIDVAGQRGNVRTVAVVASRAGLSPSLLPTDRGPGSFTLSAHNILITRLRSTFACSGTVLDWFISYLSCLTQSVFVGHESTPSVLKCGVPQGSVLGPLLFTLYTHPLSTVICQSGLSCHFFADDSQLHNRVFLLIFQFLPVV